MPLYYVELTSGCGIVKARDIAQAERKVKREQGTERFKSVRKATEKDVAWVRGMGGYVPAAH